jgi:hypothetical protein
MSIAMRRGWAVAGCLVLTVAVLAFLHVRARNADGGAVLKHVRNSFVFVIDAAEDKAFPLFGAERERVWAPDWKPQFVHPLPAEDVTGAVFRVRHGHHDAIWVNTAFDKADGHIQYAYFLPDVMVTLIDIQLVPLSGEHTQATVIYERTALSANANVMVAQHGERDSRMGPEWQAQINGYLQGYKP